MAKTKSRFKLSGEAKVELGGLDYFEKELSQVSSSSKKGIINSIYKEWANLYFDYLTRRYRRLKKGGGEWKALSKRTLETRKKYGYRKRTIFSMTHTFATAIRKNAQGEPGHYERRTKNGIILGVGGGGKYPGYKTPKGRRGWRGTVVRLVEKHARGGKKLPIRKLVQAPSNRTKRRMVVEIRKRIEKVIKNANRKVQSPGRSS